LQLERPRQIERAHENQNPEGETTGVSAQKKKIRPRGHEESGWRHPEAAYSIFQKKKRHLTRRYVYHKQVKETWRVRCGEKSGSEGKGSCLAWPRRVRTAITQGGHKKRMNKRKTHMKCVLGGGGKTPIPKIKRKMERRTGGGD